MEDDDVLEIYDFLYELNHHRLKPVDWGWLLKQPKVVRHRSYRSSFVLLNFNF